MTPSTGLSGAARAYVAAVAAAGITAVGHSIAVLSSGQLGLQWFILAGLTLLSGSFTVRIPTIPARLSVSETFVFAAAMLFGPAAATVLVVLDSLVISLWQPVTSRRGLRVLFNMSAPAVAVWVAAHVFFAISRVPPLHSAPQPVLSLLVPLLAMAAVYFLLNSWLIAAAVAFEKHTSALLVWRRNFLWLSLNFFSGASVAALLLPYLQDAGQSFFRVAGILLPLLLISYLTFKTALGRVDDANRHLNELNQLYLSTIETLAMAIDAKDQITHGHIRRVQQYAVGLARRVGITDPLQISAIEAASLLHDMGKLAVPEYILNKPGKLTPAEFDRMKLHASVGADILSAIKFPYPVVPIVRHHHENWDGSGYPDGLHGSSIPIGARILSVVDCFDALTSDRPYRPRLSDSEAIRILLERRGAMYDPLIVDTFIAVHAELVSTDTQDEPRPAERFARNAIEEVGPVASHPLENISASTEEMLAMYDLARALTGLRAENVVPVVFSNLRRLVPISACVFYQYNSASDVLSAVYAAGEGSHSFVGVQIPRGQRLTGWVAANRQTILNSDPILDLGDVARTFKPRLRSCLSTPLIADDSSLVGVLTAYSVHEEPFDEDHRRVFEAASRQIADMLATTVASERGTPGVLAAQADSLPTEDELRPLLDRFRRVGPLSVIYIEVQYSPSISETVVESAVRALSFVVKRHLKNPELLFRHGANGVAAALPGVDHSAAVQICSQLSKIISSPDQARDFSTASRIRIGCAGTPDDDGSLEALLGTARNRQMDIPPQGYRPPSVH